MARMFVSAPAPEVALVSGTAKTVLQVGMPSNHRAPIIRWGVFFEGQRIVCHEMYHHNGIGIGTQNHNPIGNPNRPVCWAQANYGTTGSSSEF